MRAAGRHQAGIALRAASGPLPGELGDGMRGLGAMRGGIVPRYGAGLAAVEPATLARAGRCVGCRHNAASIASTAALSRSRADIGRRGCGSGSGGAGSQGDITDPENVAGIEIGMGDVCGPTGVGADPIAAEFRSGVATGAGTSGQLRVPLRRRSL
jgi:hypothetical protein